MTVEIKGYGKITANMATLNLISLLAFKASQRDEIKGYEGLSKFDMNISDTIFTELNNHGYYDVKGE